MQASYRIALSQPLRREMNVTIVIDVFRAFTTASYVLDQKPATYQLAVRHQMITELASSCINPFVIGKPEKGMLGDIYTIPNSPSRVLEHQLSGLHVIHRTQAGAQGVLQAKNADIILVAGLVNAQATVKYLKKLDQPKVTFCPMGHEGTCPSVEDNLCAEYIQALLEGKKIDITPHLYELKEGPGKYFFTQDQRQYPKEDFDRCLETDRFDFAIQATLGDGYATLKAVKVSCSDDLFEGKDAKSQAIDDGCPYPGTQAP